MPSFDLGLSEVFFLNHGIHNTAKIGAGQERFDYCDLGREF